MAKLTPRQRQFVKEYLVDLNATQAAIRAGYSKKTAKQQAARLLTNVDLSEAVQRAMAARETRTEITQNRVLEEFAKVGFANMGDYLKVGMDLASLPPEMTAVIAEVQQEKFVNSEGEPILHKTKFKLHDKLGALNSIARHLGMFIDRHELAGPGGGPITFDMQSEVAAALANPEAIEAYAQANRFVTSPPTEKPVHLNGHSNGTTHN